MRASRRGRNKEREEEKKREDEIRGRHQPTREKSHVKHTPCQQMLQH